MSRLFLVIIKQKYHPLAWPQVWPSLSPQVVVPWQASSAWQAQGPCSSSSCTSQCRLLASPKWASLPPSPWVGTLWPPVQGSGMWLWTACSGSSSPLPGDRHFWISRCSDTVCSPNNASVHTHTFRSRDINTNNYSFIQIYQIMSIEPSIA